MLDVAIFMALSLRALILFPVPQPTLANEAIEFISMRRYDTEFECGIDINIPLSARTSVQGLFWSIGGRKYT